MSPTSGDAHAVPARVKGRDIGFPFKLCPRLAGTPHPPVGLCDRWPRVSIQVMSPTSGDTAQVPLQQRGVEELQVKFPFKLCPRLAGTWRMRACRSFSPPPPTPSWFPFKLCPRLAGTQSCVSHTASQSLRGVSIQVMSPTSGDC